MDKIVFRATHPLVLAVLRRTVANVDSIGFDDICNINCVPIAPLAKVEVIKNAYPFPGEPFPEQGPVTKSHLLR